MNDQVQIAVEDNGRIRTGLLVMDLKALVPHLPDEFIRIIFPAKVADISADAVLPNEVGIGHLGPVAASFRVNLC